MRTFPRLRMMGERERRAADLLNLLLNRDVVFIEGLLWAAFGVSVVHASRRRAWMASAVVACLLLAVVGVLSGLGIIGSFDVG